jgi:soluble lytic murein transglycosylase-like protein
MKSRALAIAQLYSGRKFVIFLTVLLTTTAAAYKCFAWDGYYARSLYSSIDLSTHSLDRLAAIIEQLKEGCSKEVKNPYAHSKKYQRIIYEASKRHGVDPSLIWAVIKAESNFQPHVVSKAGARGLMQIMPETAKDLGIIDCFDPRQNIFGGTLYLKNLLVRFESCIPLSVAAYNSGCTPVEAYGGIPPFPETRAYVRRVMKFYRFRTGNQ